MEWSLLSGCCTEVVISTALGCFFSTAQCFISTARLRGCFYRVPCGRNGIGGYEGRLRLGSSRSRAPVQQALGLDRHVDGLWADSARYACMSLRVVVSVLGLVGTFPGGGDTVRHSSARSMSSGVRGVLKGVWKRMGCSVWFVLGCPTGPQVSGDTWSCEPGWKTDLFRSNRGV